jgi:hypothetical protein
MTVWYAARCVSNAHTSHIVLATTSVVFVVLTTTPPGHATRPCLFLHPLRSQCLKFVTDQQQDLKRVDKLNNLFLTYMCGKDPYADPTEEQQAAGTPASARPASGGDEAAGGGTPASAGKKKAKRR